jgi:hypothetical protein
MPGILERFNHFGYLKEEDESIQEGVEIIEEREPETRGGIDLTTSPSPPRRNSTNKSTDPETVRLSPPPTPPRPTMKKAERIDAIVKEFTRVLESGETLLGWSCAKCNISNTSCYYFAVPRLESDAMSLIGHTPASLKDCPEIKKHFHDRTNDLKQRDWEDLCTWRSNYVEVCVALLAHAFHCPKVQCLFLPEVGCVQHGSADEETVQLGPEITTVLAIAHKDNHFSALKVDLSTRHVEIWDAARVRKDAIARYWREHAVAAIRRHWPTEVEEEGSNVLYVKKKKDWQPRDGMPLWTLDAGEGYYKQVDCYTCGPIAINRFAEMLKELSGGTHLGDGIDEFVKFVDTPEGNITNAKFLLKCLLEKKHDSFFLPASADETEGKTAESNDQMEAKPNIGSTPEHPRDSNAGPLEDTPCSHQSGRAAVPQAKRLRKIAVSKGKGTGNPSKEEAALNCPKEKGNGKVDLCVDHDQMAASGGDGGEDVWTKDEEDEEEYGHKRRFLKRFGVHKRHVENMKTVKKHYPALEVILNYITSKKKCTDEQVAEAIRGVPSWDPKGLMEKESNCAWLRDHILCLPERIPGECQYAELERRAAVLNEKLRRRSHNLYERKKREEAVRLDLLRCPIHGEKQKSVLELSK